VAGDSSMLMQIYRKTRRNITQDGLIVGSSRFLVSAMLDKIDFSRPLRILEIGSGRGAFTRKILQRMSAESVLDICEIQTEYNPWIEQIIAAHPGKQVNFYNCCVTEVLTTAEHYDIIISSLPLKNLESIDNKEFLYRVIGTIRFGLKAGGSYLQYQYFKSNKSDIENTFGKGMDEINFVPLNIPPAFVYNMTK
jgi:phospholipid N-methyltransferase